MNIKRNISYSIEGLSIDHINLLICLLDNYEPNNNRRITNDERQNNQNLKTELLFNLCKIDDNQGK